MRAAGIGVIGLLWAASEDGEPEDISKVMLAVGVTLLAITAAKKIFNIFTRCDFNKKVRERHKKRLNPPTEKKLSVRESRGRKNSSVDGGPRNGPSSEKLILDNKEWLDVDSQRLMSLDEASVTVWPLGGKPLAAVVLPYDRKNPSINPKLQDFGANRQGRDGRGLFSLRSDLQTKGSAKKNSKRLS